VVNDLAANVSWVTLMCLILVLSGIGQLVSLIQFGVPAVPLVAATLVELVVIPLLLRWLWCVVRKV
jgi:hypothetical protein